MRGGCGRGGCGGGVALPVVSGRVRSSDAVVAGAVLLPAYLPACLACIACLPCLPACAGCKVQGAGCRGAGCRVQGAACLWWWRWRRWRLPACGCGCGCRVRCCGGGGYGAGCGSSDRPWGQSPQQHPPECSRSPGRSAAATPAARPCQPCQTVQRRTLAATVATTAAPCRRRPLHPIARGEKYPTPAAGVHPIARGESPISNQVVCRFKKCDLNSINPRLLLGNR